MADTILTVGSIAIDLICLGLLLWLIFKRKK